MPHIEEFKNALTTQIKVCQEIKSLDQLKAMIIAQLELVTDPKRLDLIYRLLVSKR